MSGFRALCVPKTSSVLIWSQNRLTSAAMAALIFLLLNLGASLFKSKSRLEAENAALRQQLIVLQRKVRGRVQFTNSDRLFFIQLYRWFPSALKAITIIRPETLVRWHRAGFRRYWRRKSRNPGGRPQISADLRALIRRMSVENLLWGAPRIHGCCSLMCVSALNLRQYSSNDISVRARALTRSKPLSKPSDV
jgi:hypothetical protein